MEQLEEALGKLGGAAPWQKAVGLCVLVAFLCAGYWYFFLDDVLQERSRLIAETARLNQEKLEYEGRKKEYQAFRKEIAQLIAEQRDVLKLLPKKDDMEQFVEAMQQQMELAGLTKTSLTREAAVPQELFIRLPVKISVYGTYHQLMRFFKSMTEIPRIVAVEDLKLVPGAEQGQVAAKGMPEGTLKAEFVAVAFQYLDKAGAKPAAAGGAGAAGAGMTPVAQSGGSGGEAPK